MGLIKDAIARMTTALGPRLREGVETRAGAAARLGLSPDTYKLATGLAGFPKGHSVIWQRGLDMVTTPAVRTEEANNWRDAILKIADELR